MACRCSRLELACVILGSLRATWGKGEHGDANLEGNSIGLVLQAAVLAEHAV